MKSPVLTALALVVASLPLAALAQEPVVGAPNPDALFHSPNPRLNANMQAVYHIEKDLLGAGHWDEADKYLTARYLQHNPSFPSGRDTVVNAFSKFMKPRPIPAKLQIPVVAVVAQGDMVIVATPRVVKDANDPSKTYTTTWFDMWRMKDGKADEHWDCATKMR
ncbi:MAG TPA: nuclear transport factor 2 family protein [Steroidobacteraceae bacterium]|jgi:predicted SnoaL-like aldol condensation-catalyzing enzyme|nr:nuclear transport factor 2 family protein [Steroidobacteraceae bacterium]